MQKLTSQVNLRSIMSVLIFTLILSHCAAPALATESDPPAPRRVVYLTFDDGPYREVTPYLLDLLKQEEIRATFFVLPRENVDDLYKRIIDEGHELANHSFTHNYNRLYGRTLDNFRQEVMKAHDFVLDNFEYNMTSFRFPGGPFGRPQRVFDERRAILAELGYREFAWHVDSNDWRPNVRHMTGTQLATRVLDAVDALQNDDHIIILFHDVPWSVRLLEAMPLIITGLRERGFTFDITRNFPLTEAELEMLKEQNAARRKTERQRELKEILLVESLR